MAIELINDGPVTILLDTKSGKKTCSQIRLHVFDIEQQRSTWLIEISCPWITKDRVLCSHRTVETRWSPNLGEGSGLYLTIISWTCRICRPVVSLRDGLGRLHKLRLSLN